MESLDGREPQENKGVAFSHVFSCDTAMAKAAGKSARDGKQITIELTTEAADLLAKYVADAGGRGVQKSHLSRLVTWFVGLRPDFRATIIGWGVKGNELERAIALEKWAKELREQHHRGSA